MKGADKAIVAKSFGKWKSSSLRSRTMEKPDEPSGESKEESLSKYTCADPQLGKKPVGKSASFPDFQSTLAVCFCWFFLFFFLPCFSVNYYCGDVCGLFFIFFYIFFPLSFSFDSLVRHIWWTNKPHCWAGEFLLRQSVSPMIRRCQEKTKQKIANTKTVTGAWEKERSEWMVTAVPRRSFSVSQCGGWTSDKDAGEQPGGVCNWECLCLFFLHANVAPVRL